MFPSRALLAILVMPQMAAAQQAIVPDLVALAERKQVHVPGRSIEPLVEGTRRGFRVSAAAGEWPALLPDLQFANGIIEFDLRGEDLQGQSFLGIAFHARDTLTYDAIYFRPFNFRIADSVRRAHAVQYISQPDHPWQRLRADSPGRFERPINVPLDPNEWFHVKVLVAAPSVRVFVGDAEAPALTVNQLTTRTNGGIGFWIGNGSTAEFANLRIQPRSRRHSRSFE